MTAFGENPNDTLSLLNQKARALGVPDAPLGSPTNAVEQMNRMFRQAGLPDSGAPNEPLPLYVYEQIGAAGTGTLTPASFPDVQVLGALIGTGVADTGTADALNLLVSTQQAFAGIDWVPSSCTMADVNSLAPDSTSTGSTLTEVAATAQHYVRQGWYAAASAQQVTFEISLKQGLRTRAAIYIHDIYRNLNTDYAGVVFDLAGGVVGVAASTAGAFATATSAISSQSNGWYLCKLNVTTSASGKYAVTVYADAGSGVGAANLSYAGNAGSVAISVWGARLYAGAITGSYTPLNANTGAAATTVNQVFVPNGTTTAYWGTRTPNAWVGFDAGVPVQWTRYRFAPRPSPTTVGQWPWAPDWAQTIQGSLVQTSVSDAAFGTPTTVDTIPGGGLLTLPYYPRFWLSERPIAPGTPSRYLRVMPPSISYGGFSALQVFATLGTAANACPVQPVISPMGGRFPTRNPTVTITSTVGAAIYYTTDGSTPTTASTLYTAPFVLSIAPEATATVKAIANLASLSTPNSLVTTSPPFCRYGYHPNDNWYDDKGNLIECHSGSSILWDPNTQAYYRVGQFMNINSVLHYSTTVEPNYAPAVFLYQSADLMNWKNLGPILNDPFPLQPVAGNYMLMYNALNNNYVIWTTVLDASATSTLYYASTSGANILGPWSYNLTPIVASAFYNFTVAIDSDGVAAYVVWRKYDGAEHTYIQQLNSSYTGLTGAPLVQNNAALREGYGFFKYPNTAGGTWFLVTGQANPYDSTANMDVRYTYNQGATPLVNSWNAVPSSGASAFAVSPTGTNFNGQPFATSLPQGKVQPFYIADYWVPGNLYAGRQVWLPMTMTSTTLQIQQLASWNPAELGLSAGQLSGSVATFTSNQATNLTSLAASVLSDWAAFGYNVNSASIERKATGGSQISVLSPTGSALSQANISGTRHWAHTWTDGTPDASISNEAYVVFNTAGGVTGGGMAFTVPADTNVRTLKIYVGVSNNGSSNTSGKLTATLSDASALPYVDTGVSTTSGDTDQKLGVYTLTYAAAAAGQTLAITFVNNQFTNGQNVQISAVVIT